MIEFNSKNILVTGGAGFIGSNLCEHLLNHGADLRTVQLLLGHTSLSTTQIYTEVARHRMKELHNEHHPRG